MGYTHYWYRKKEMPKAYFEAIVRDFKSLLPSFAGLGVKLADGMGEGEPVINDDEVIFNGDRHCGHKTNEHIAIAWPSKYAAGVGSDSKEAIVGSWFAGAKLQTRVCDGDCSHETFYFPRVLHKGHIVGPICYYKADGKPVYNEPEVVGKWFDFCKTAFKPYDLAVTAFLIIARHHLVHNIVVRSDGEAQHWMDAAFLVNRVLGYAIDANFLEREEAKVEAET